jgi:hypothetical protein
VPFAKLASGVTIGSDGELQAESGVPKVDDDLVRHYQSRNKTSGSEILYTYVKYGDGDRFRELGMMTRHGHFCWELFYKNNALIDWMFRQRRRATNQLRRTELNQATGTGLPQKFG